MSLDPDFPSFIHSRVRTKHFRWRESYPAAPNLMVWEEDRGTRRLRLFFLRMCMNTLYHVWERLDTLLVGVMGMAGDPRWTSIIWVVVVLGLDRTRCFQDASKTSSSPFL